METEFKLKQKTNLIMFVGKFCQFENITWGHVVIWNWFCCETQIYGVLLTRFASYLNSNYRLFSQSFGYISLFGFSLVAKRNHSAIFTQMPSKLPTIHDYLLNNTSSYATASVWFGIVSFVPLVCYLVIYKNLYKLIQFLINEL